MIRTTAYAAFGALALLAGQSSLASAAYDPASAYVGQFSSARVHIETTDRSVTNPAQDYIDGLRVTFRSQKRVGADAPNYNASESYINKFN